MQHQEILRDLASSMLDKDFGATNRYLAQIGLITAPNLRALAPTAITGGPL